MAAEVHLEEPILGVHVALGQEQVLGVVGVDVRYAVLVAQHLDLRLQSGHREIAAQLREGPSDRADHQAGQAASANTSTTAVKISQRGMRRTGSA